MAAVLCAPKVPHGGGIFVALATVLICPISLAANTVIISVTGSPGLSTLIDYSSVVASSVVSTSWSESKSFSGVTISILVNSAIVGQTPSADAFLTTSIGPGTTVIDEVASTQFTVPLQLPVCSQYSCGADVTLFSGLNLGPGTYFLTLAPDDTSSGEVGWFPAMDPTVLENPGVIEGTAFFDTSVASYPPAGSFVANDFAMDFTVTGTAVAPVPEPATVTPLVGLGALFLLLTTPSHSRKVR
jgi:hypothetical protein